MTRHIHPAELLEHRIQDVITDKEYDVLLLRAKGLSPRQISLALDLSRSAVREREFNGIRKIDIHRRKENAA